MKRARTYFISAGEHSGDLIAADLVNSMKQILPQYQAIGLVGNSMINAGVRPIATNDQLGVMGVAEVIQRIHILKMFETTLLARIDYEQPEFAILVDFPGLHFRLAEQLKKRGIPVIQYVAPKLWAWGASRAHALKEDFDLVLGILPSEEKFFQELGVNYQFVGSPHKDRVNKVTLSKETLGLDANKLHVAVLPGSREAELKYILPIMLRVAETLHQQVPGVEFIMPLSQNLTFADLERMTEPILRNVGATISHAKIGSGIDALRLGQINVVSGMSLEIMSVADAALLASGTATLECALVGTPMVVVYAMSASNYAYAQKVIKVANISLVNILAGKRVVPEFVQVFDDSEVVDSLRHILPGAPGHAEQLNQLHFLRDNLKGEASMSAATTIADALDLKH